MRAIVFAGGLLTSALSYPFAAYGQAQSDAAGSTEAQPGPDATEPNSTSDILVTARKREERLQDVPISVNVTTGAALTQTATRRLDEVAVYIPNLTVQRAIATPTFFIRGIGSVVSNLAFEPSVGLFVDGIYNGRSRQGATAFLDLQRIEVLRGPQSALFGKNTSAGAINIISNDPTNRPEYSATVTGTFDGDNGVEATGVSSGPVTEKLLARLALKFSDNDGWIRNATSQRQEPRRRDILGRATILYNASDSVHFKLKVEGFDQHVKGDYLAQVVRGTPITLDRQSSPGVLENDLSSGSNSSLTADLELGSGHTLTSITGYSQFNYVKHVDGDAGPAPNLATIFGEDFHQISQELRVSSPASDKFDYIAGAYTSRVESDIMSQSFLTFSVFNGNQLRKINQVTKPISIYAQGTYRFTDALRLTVGARQSWETKSANQIRVNTGTVPATFVTAPLSGVRHESFFDPSAQLQYFITPNIMTYASFARGSKGGGFVFGQSSGTLANFQFEGERSTSFELGTKLTLFDRRATLNVTLYNTNYDNLQVTIYDGATATTITRNAAAARSKGAEIEAAFQVSPILSLRASGAYLDGKYTSYPNAPCTFGKTAPVGTVCTEDLSGHRLPRASKFSGSATAALDVPMDSVRFKASATGYGRTDFFTDDTFDPLGRQNGFIKLDARIALAERKNGWEIALIGKNLTNRVTQTLSYTAPFVTNRLVFALDPGRVLAVQGSVKF